MKFLTKKTMFPVLLLIFLFVSENGLLAYNNLQNKTPIFGLRVNNEGVTGKSAKKLATIIASYQQNLPIKFVRQGQTFEVFPKDVGYTIDAGMLTNKVLESGRTGSILDKLLVQHLALFGLKNIPVEGKVNDALLTIKILTLQDEIDTDAQPIHIDFSSNSFPILPASEGNKIQTDTLKNLILRNIAHPPITAIAIPTYVVFPSQHAEAELTNIRKSIPNLIRLPLSITSGGLVFTLSPDDIRSMLSIVERPDPKDPKKTVLLLRLNEKMLNVRLGVFAERLETATGTEFNDHDARIAIYAQFYSGTRRPIDIPTANRQISFHKNVLAATDTTGPKVAYLTFDDGPNSIYQPMILDILEHYHVPATFFFIGQNAVRDAAVAVRTRGDGNLLGNHSLTHAFLPKLSNASILKELTATNDILRPLNMGDIHIFRPPYGGVNSVVVKTAADLGLKMYLWDVDPRDWTEPATDELVRRVVSFTNNGSNVLLHSNHLATVRALPQIIEQLKAKGFEFRLVE